MRLNTTLFLGAATLALTALCAAAQPVRTAATETAVPAVAPASPAPSAGAFSPAPASTPTPAAAATVATAEPAPPITSSDNTDGITATVGDNSISDYELNQRIALVLATNFNNIKPTAEDIARVRKNVLQDLIDTHLEMAEARKLKITVSPVDVDKALQEIATHQHVTMKELTDTLAKAGTSLDVLRAQQTEAMAWRKVLATQFGGDIVATPAMVDDALHRAAEGATKTHYHVVEIFLPVDAQDSDAKQAETKKLADDLETKLRGGASIRTLAAQYSRNPSASQGGDMGLIYDGQLEPVLNDALAAMHTGELSKPIRAKGGWYILGLMERLEPLGTNVAATMPEIVVGPTTVLPLARLLLPMPTNTPPDTVKNILRNAEQIREAATSCDTLEKISQDPQLKGFSVFSKLGDMKVGDLSEGMQKALSATKGGEAAAPFQDEAGVEIIVRCDERAPPPRTAFTMPTRDDIENDLFNEQISAIARRYLRDLRRDANIRQRDDDAVLDAALIQ